jgi:PAS domain S-box-containing protein
LGKQGSDPATMMMAVEKSGMPVLILMPKGPEEALATKALTRADIRTDICERPDQLAEHITDQTGAVLLAEEALVGAQISQFLRSLSAQPPWSDLPLLVLTSGSEADDAHHRILDLFGPNANVTFIARPLRDLTLVSAVQAAVRARRHQFAVRDLIEERETVLASISDAFSTVDRKWRYTHVNDKVAAFAGQPANKMIGRVIWEIFPDAVGTEFYDRCQHVMRTGEPSHGEFFHAPWDRWLDVRIYPTKEGIVIFRGDITERKKQEELSQEREAKLKESQDRLRLATEAADIGTFDFFPKTGELQLSDRSKELFGMPPEGKVTCETYLAGVHPNDRHNCARNGPTGAPAWRHRPLRYRIPHDWNTGWQRTMGGRARPRRPGSVRRSDAIHRNHARHHGREECRNPFAAREERGGRGQPGERSFSRDALA